MATPPACLVASIHTLSLQKFYLSNITWWKVYLSAVIHCFPITSFKRKIISNTIQHLCWVLLPAIRILVPVGFADQIPRLLRVTFPKGLRSLYDISLSRMLFNHCHYIILQEKKKKYMHISILQMTFWINKEAMHETIADPLIFIIHSIKIVIALFNTS